MTLPHVTARKILPLLSFCLVLACQVGDDTPSATRFSRQNLFLGTIYTVTVNHRRPPAEVYGVYERVVRDLNRLERMVDFQSSGSDISRINSAAGGTQLDVSPAFARLLDDAARYFRDTNGCFDITVHPLLAEWGFYRQQRLDPDPARIDDIRRRVGFHRVHWPTESGRLQIPDGGVQLDFGGMIKGVALDRAAALLRADGLDNFHLGFGRSSHFAVGPGEGQGWRIPVAAPRHPGRPLLTAILDGQALAVSAGGEDWHTPQGERYSMIVDPRSGRTVRAPKMAAVVSPEGATADAWSTALLVDEGLQLLGWGEAGRPAAAVILTEDDSLRWFPDRIMAQRFFNLAAPPR
jgi:thiamine biosynthesis lipoprotein